MRDKTECSDYISCHWYRYKNKHSETVKVF